MITQVIILTSVFMMTATILSRPEKSLPPTNGIKPDEIEEDKLDILHNPDSM